MIRVMKSKGKCPYIGRCDFSKKGECYNPTVAGFCPPEAIPPQRNYNKMQRQEPVN